MKRTIFFLAAAAAVLMVSGCNMMAGSGIVTESEFDLDGFKSVEAGYTCDLTVTQGDDFSVIISCDDNLVDYLIVGQTDDTLKIDLQPFTNYNNITFKATVIMPELNAVTASGASSAKVTGFDSRGAFSVNITGASDGELSFLSAEDINAVISGASRLSVSSVSAGRDLDINCSGASKADFRNFSARNVNAYISGASNGWVSLSGRLSGTVSGASGLYYDGRADISGIQVDIASDLSVY